jgi:hypothetical protein
MCSRRGGLPVVSSCHTDLHGAHGAAEQATEKRTNVRVGSDMQVPSYDFPTLISSQRGGFVSFSSATTSACPGHGVRAGIAGRGFLHRR